jgi:hypothetical protein
MFAGHNYSPAFNNFAKPGLQKAGLPNDFESHRMMVRKEKHRCHGVFTPRRFSRANPRRFPPTYFPHHDSIVAERSQRRETARLEK